MAPNFGRRGKNSQIFTGEIKNTVVIECDFQRAGLLVQHDFGGAGFGYHERTPV